MTASQLLGGGMILLSFLLIRPEGRAAIGEEIPSDNQESAGGDTSNLR